MSVYRTIGPLVIVIIPDKTILLYSLAVILILILPRFLLILNLPHSHFDCVVSLTFLLIVVLPDSRFEFGSSFDCDTS